jgi:CHAT domain-containing protein
LLTARNQRAPGERPAQRRARIAQADAAWLAAAGQLSQLLLGPVRSELANKRLLIVGQGALQYVPFNALPEPKRGGAGQPSPRRTARPTQDVVPAYRPLIAKHEVIVLPSASILTLLRRENGPPRDRSKTTIAILADPVFTADDARVHMSSAFSGAPLPEKNSRPLATAAPLLRALRDLNTATKPQPSPARANAVNEDSLDPKIPRLYATRHEAEAISALLPAQQQLRALDFAASRATATSPKLGQYQIIHFATHALIDDLHPELSGIVLSLVDEQGQLQDGFLRAHEIYNLKLPADLVVLSACQTGLGKDVQGEGLIGLTHSFMYAGAARVIVSSWKIDDTATATLMAAFYQNLFNAQHLSLAAAFRAAQIQAWRSGRWPSPYFWAGFTFQGDWR